MSGQSSPRNILFLLNPSNHDFVAGHAPQPQAENPRYLIVLKLLGLALVIAIAGSILIQALQRMSTELPGWPTLIAAAAATFIGWITYWTIVPILRNRRFERPCKIVYGELVKFDEVDDDGTIDWRVGYRFLSPSGNPINGKWTTEGTITRVEGRPKPPLGAIVAIAYIDDRTHRML